MKALSTIQKSETINRHMGLQEWGLIIILSILWGDSFFFVGIAVKEIPPYQRQQAIHKTGPLFPSFYLFKFFTQRHRFYPGKSVRYPYDQKAVP
jgi:hypothetical protein